jgi:hypothetical protein
MDYYSNNNNNNNNNLSKIFVNIKFFKSEICVLKTLIPFSHPKATLLHYRFFFRHSHLVTRLLRYKKWKAAVLESRSESSIKSSAEHQLRCLLCTPDHDKLVYCMNVVQYGTCI